MDWNRYLVNGPGIGVAALAAGLVLGVSACSPSPSSSQNSAAPAATPASNPVASTPASSAAPVPGSTSSGTGNGNGNATGGTGSVDQNVVLDDCNNVGIVEPSSYTPTCADNNYVLNNIQWMSWTAEQATGTAVATVNLCQPTCAAGKTGEYPVSVVFSGSATDPTDSTATTYITLTATYTAAQPPGAGASQTFQVGPNG